ncbi:MAG: dihydroorotate dehydrogenase [Thermodesulfobacteriota bacterium]|nr:dihydroorotate dehydrogenase [Thermodesulfobacteriota bacterium]
MDLSVNVAGLALKNPILTASGTFGSGLEFSRFGDLKTLGGIIVKGMSLKPRQGNLMERIAEAPCGMLNAVGIQNPGAKDFVEKKLSHLPWKDTPVIVNLYAASPEEFGDLAAYMAAQEGIAALEVNISCPNVQHGGVAFGHDSAQAALVTQAVKKNAGEKPVMVKLSPNVTDIAEVARAVQDAGADILSAINTLRAMAVDIGTRKPELSNIIGGLSGPAIKPVALRCVYEIARAVDIPVVGVGGVASVRDILEFILVGAHAVQIGTANFMRPDFAFKAVEALPGLVDELGITSWEDFRGSLRV